MFILLEDEHGTINLIVPPPVYERHRLIVRTKPLMIVAGKLERFAAAGGAINVLVSEMASIETPERPGARSETSRCSTSAELARIAQDKAATTTPRGPRISVPWRRR